MSTTWVGGGTVAAKWESAAAAAIREQVAELGRAPVRLVYRATALVPANQVDQWLDDGWELDH